MLPWQCNERHRSERRTCVSIETSSDSPDRRIINENAGTRGIKSKFLLIDWALWDKYRSPAVEPRSIQPLNAGEVVVGVYACKAVVVLQQQPSS